MNNFPRWLGTLQISRNLFFTFIIHKKTLFPIKATISCSETMSCRHSYGIVRWIVCWPLISSFAVFCSLRNKMALECTPSYGYLSATVLRMFRPSKAVKCLQFSTFMNHRNGISLKSGGIIECFRGKLFFIHSWLSFMKWSRFAFMLRFWPTVLKNNCLLNSPQPGQ